MAEFLGIGWYRNHWAIKYMKVSKRKESIKDINWYRFVKSTGLYNLSK